MTNDVAVRRPRGPANQEEMAPIGRRILELLEARQETQSWLSTVSGVSNSTISRLMYGMIAPRYNTLVRVAGALGVAPAELMRAAGEPISISARVAYIAEQLQRLVDESSEERAAEILDLLEAQVRLLRGE